MRFILAVFSLIAIFSAVLFGQSNPVPFVTQPLVPATVVPGTPGFTLTVNGTGFVEGSVINWNGSPRATTFVNRSQLTATILASDVAVAETGTVTVVSPSPGGGVSNPVFLGVTNPFRQITFTSSSFGSVLQPLWMTAADFRGDGNLDLVTGSEDGILAAFLGNGNGTFQAEHDYVVGTNTDAVSSVAALDLNGNGKLDLVSSGFSTAPAAAVLLGNGDGTFGTTSFYPADVGYFVTGDFNGDGFVDLAYVDFYTAHLAVLPGKGDGTFGAAIVSNASAPEAFYLVAGDFNKDGKLDLAISFANSGFISIALGNGDGTFAQPVIYSAGINPYGIVAADFDGDGNLDVAVTNDNDALTNSVSVFLGNGDGTFKPYVQYVVGQSPTMIATGDMDGDGKLDLMVMNDSPIGASVSVLFGNGDGTFQPQVVFPAAANWTIVPGDFNGDGRLDLAIADRTNNKVGLLTQIPSVNLSPTTLSYPNQIVGTTSSTQTVTLTNASNTQLQIYSIAISATNSNDFAQTNTCPATLNPGANCKISVVYAPRLVESDTATLTVMDSGAPNTQTVALSGNSIGPVVVLSKRHLAFGNQVIGTVSPAQVFTLANSGTMSLTISALTANSDFTQTNTCGTSVAVGGSCSITVRFKPTVIGSRTGAVTIKDNAGPPTQIVQLFGIGTDVSLSTASLVFPPQQVGTTSLPVSVQLTNVGSTALTISGFSMAGPSAADFAQTNNCGAGIAAGGSCSIEVAFAPSVKGIRNASLEISDSGGGSPQQIKLTGTGK